MNKQTRQPTIPNTLADRYASSHMVKVFSPEGRILLERELWIAVMKTQAELGLDIPKAAIEAYEKAKDTIDLEWIKNREREIRHDQKAKLEAFNKIAGYEYAHLGMTSRDLSDNVEQMQNKQGLIILRDHTVAVLAKMARLAVEYNSLVYPERTHLAVAQPSVIGKIFANFGQELLIAFNRLETLIENYPLRGIKGAVGTQTDQLQLFDGDSKKVALLEKKIVTFLGFKNVLTSVGQVYPRSLDFEVIATLFQLVCGPAGFAMTAREMAGFEEFTEGFKKGQVGSTAMPHKMNSRNSERIFSFKNSLMGYVVMAAGISGNQIFAGDVSDSATRRIALPDTFFAADGTIETLLTILDECGFYPAVIQREMDKYLPFLTTTRLLMTAVKEGIGRETAHAVIKEHAIAVALEMRNSAKQNNDLLDRLSQDSRLSLTKEKLAAAIAKPIEFVGNAPTQIATFAADVEKITKKYPQAALYNPEEIL
ncbi:MAG TPA: adenylosuccinate lyase [Candidatus Sulfotelmatobacter sp.]|jgi:adenylosuccinate lyase|nr:adenylosuccinate lyase [Candidatus Sulfotelmatobacter sp.]